MRQLLNIFIILIFGFIALNLALSLPFYYSWDMDMITVTDLLLLKDNMMPVHLNHPGMGMYWLMTNVQSAAEYFNLVTPLKLSNLSESYEPLLLVAEHSQLMRITNVFACLGIAIFLWAALRKFFAKTFLADTLVLLVFLTLPGLWKYDLLMVRTEIYSLLFWSISLFFLLRSADEDTVTYNAILAGFFASLSFFTKIQVFFLLPLLVFFYTLKQEKSLKINNAFKFRYWWFLGTFIIMAAIAVASPLPDNVADFANRYWVNKFFFCFVLALYVVKRLQKIDRFVPLTQFFTAFYFGALLVVFLPLLSSLNFSSALLYGFLNFKVLFLRISRFASLGQFDIIYNAQGLLAANWLYVISAFLLLIYSWLKLGRHVSLIIIFAIMTAQLLLGARISIQDSLWIEIPFLVVAILLLSRFNKYFTLSLLTVFLLFNINKATEFKSLKLEEQIAYYDGLMYFRGIFVQGNYTAAMDARYTNPESKINALQLANRISEIKNILFLNFSNTNLNLRDVSGNQNFWAINLKNHASEELLLYYRPDQTQKIYWPASHDLNMVTVENCEKIPLPQAAFGEKQYVGFILKGLIGKGREIPVHCKIKSSTYNGAFVSVEHIPQATFVGY